METPTFEPPFTDFSIYLSMSPSSVASNSSSSRSSPTPLPQKSKGKKQPKKSGKADIKGKKKLASAMVENVNHNKDGTSWEYEPHEGAVLINTRDEDAGEFDWDAVNNDSDNELWLIRVPESVCDSFSRTSLLRLTTYP